MATTPCALCPAVDGVRPMATVKVWLLTGFCGVTRTATARQYELCESCLREAIEHGDMVPGAAVEVL